MTPQNWRIIARVAPVALGAVNAGLAILLSQGQGILSEGGMLLVAVLSAGISFALAALPSAAGLSSLEPSQETTVVRRAERTGFLVGMGDKEAAV
jgi:hypothetical protein